MVILGIDPGLNTTGFGAIDVSRGSIKCLRAGDIRPEHKQPIANRLRSIYDGLAAVIEEVKPAVLVLEAVFTHQRYMGTASMMAHARGVVCLAAQQRGVDVVEYSPARVKKAITGHGAAAKTQVSKMVGRFIDHVDPSWSYDATDALSLAIAHSQMERVGQIIEPSAIARKSRRLSIKKQLAKSI